jgi:tetratricopeptide (TPR) repeat protein
MFQQFRIATILTATVFVNTAVAQHHRHDAAGAKPIALVSGLGDVSHPVSTKSAEAQKYFDQGLAFCYGFNHEEAIRSFKRAAELDPELAMAYWGIALALGPNINLPIDADRMKSAYEAVLSAISLSPKADEQERAYVQALAKRYSLDPKSDWKKLDRDYRDAMREVARQYPDDLDAATLYAESIMDLNPWNFWSKDGRPNEGTEEIIAVLESVLKRNPDHVGANHYYIHAVEACKHPEWAIPASEKLKALAPAAGHLVHMPAHIDFRTGNYEAAARSNAYAAEADRNHFSAFGSQGMYPIMYYTHNLHFLAVANAAQGRYADAKKAAGQLESYLSPHLNAPMPEQMLGMIDAFYATPTLMLMRFQRWDDLMKAPTVDPRLRVSAALRNVGRGLAFCARGNLAEAKSEEAMVADALRKLPDDATYGLSSAKAVLGIADNILLARIAAAAKDAKSAVNHLKTAVELEDSLAYEEPPGWYLPVRESLGALLLRTGNHVEAEAVFRTDLERNPRSGRSLFGLMKSLEAQGKKTAAQSVRVEFEKAWRNADTMLRLEDM